MRIGGKKKLSLCWTNYALRHEDILGGGGKCIDLRFLDFCTSWRWVVRFMLRPFQPPLEGKSPRNPLDRRLDGPQSRPGRCREVKILALPGLELRFLGHLSSRQSLYPLRWRDLLNESRLLQIEINRCYSEYQDLAHMIFFTNPISHHRLEVCPMWFRLIKEFPSPFWGGVEPSPLLPRSLLGHFTSPGWWWIMMCVEQSVECLARKTEVLGENMRHCCIVHHKFHMT
jgi:hypothetical protein